MFVTNHLNLMFSLAAGLITPPSGFGDKYYKDTLSAYPGWIPLFIEKIPKSAINISVAEATHLRPVIVKINRDNLAPWIMLRNDDSANPPVIVKMNRDNLDCKDLNDQGVFRDSDLFPETKKEKSNTKTCLLVQGAISTPRIELIYTQSDEDLASILSQAQLRNNVPLPSGIIKRKKTLFDGALKRWKWQSGGERDDGNTPIHLAQATGGILAMLYHVKDKGEIATQSHKTAFETESQEPPVPGLGEWMRNGSIIPWSQSVHGYLLWSIVEKVAEHRNQCNDNDLDGIVLDLLERVPEEIRSQTTSLCKTLGELSGLGGMTIPEYFHRHKSPFEHALILFFLRRSFQDLSDSDKELISDEDWVYSAILFGARSGWLRLPLEMRGSKDLQEKISDCMASFCNRISS